MSVRKISIVKNTEKSVQNYRFYSQLFFIFVSVWIGVEFHLFIQQLESPLVPHSFYRPPGVEAFLPISALMSFLYFLKTGVVHSVHPAGFFMFIAFVSISFVLGKSFCSWVCPVGFISEMTGEFGKKLLPKKWRMPKLLDIPLRSLKYLLLLFFANAIFTMTAIELNIFLSSDYNIIADVKMYDFFRFMTQTAFIILISLFILSILFQNFWCRYLCPYGALLGVIGLLSPLKITRKVENCIDCKLCDKVCPSNIKVSKVKKVISDECTSCISCIDACPVENTLILQTTVANHRVKKLSVLIATGIVYFLIISSAIALGKWQNDVSFSKYKALYQTKDSVNH